jgi:hypothetical protein
VILIGAGLRWRRQPAAHRMAGGFVGEDETALHGADVNALFTKQLQQKEG